MDLNNRYLSKTSPLNKNRFIGGMDFDSTYEVQTKRVKSSTMEIENFIRNSTTGTIGLSVDNNQTANITFTLSPKVSFKSNQNMALVYAAVYEGTSAVAGSQIYPSVGGSQTGTAYEVRSGYEYDSAHGTNTVFTVAVTNKSGGSKNIYYRANAVYIQERYGESS